MNTIVLFRQLKTVSEECETASSIEERLSSCASAFARKEYGEVARIHGEWHRLFDDAFCRADWINARLSDIFKGIHSPRVEHPLDAVNFVSRDLGRKTEHLELIHAVSMPTLCKLHLLGYLALWKNRYDPSNRTEASPFDHGIHFEVAKALERLQSVVDCELRIQHFSDARTLPYKPF